MKITFLGQGYEPESVNAVGNHLMKFLASKNFESFFGISAFASEAGVIGLGEYINNAKNNFKSLTLIVGVDQEGTSKEALREILELNINGYIFYQKEPPIFHPKIYLFEGKKETKLILGSSNLTARGLFGNVESSLLIEFPSTDLDGKKVIADLKNYYNGLFNLNDPNLFKISTKVIEDFILKGIVPNESVRKKKDSKLTIDQKRKSTGIEVPTRKTAGAPPNFRNRSRSKAIAKIIDELEITSTAGTSKSTDAVSVLVWQSGPLTERDLTIPKGANTHQTGSMLFKKGLLEGIDQRHYFRDVVFSSLNWRYDTKSSTAHLEKATAIIRLIILGIDQGVFSLTITHNPKTDTRSYEQKNSMTSISWGETRKLIAKRSLIGKSANLYQDVTKANEYTLVIE